METLKTAPLGWINDQCAEQDARYRSGHDYDTSYCYELWRRALDQGDNAAWALVYERYAGLVTRWVWTHPSFRVSGETADYFVNNAFARFWQAVSQKSFTTRFSSLEETLHYLKLTSGAAVLDHFRKQQRRLLTVEFDEIVAATVPDKGNPPIEENLAATENAADLWSRALYRCNTKQERVVLRQWLLYDRTARQIAADHPEHFKDVKSVYRTKENLLKRLRRDAESGDLLTPGGEKVAP
jgi:DNA-directed RNA polymerase specialized sigma24 family protein